MVIIRSNKDHFSTMLYWVQSIRIMKYQEDIQQYRINQSWGLSGLRTKLAVVVGGVYVPISMLYFSSGPLGSVLFLRFHPILIFMKIKSRAVCILDSQEAFDFNWVLKAHLFVFINFYFDLWVKWPDIYYYYHIMLSFVILSLYKLLYYNWWLWTCFQNWW